MNRKDYGPLRNLNQPTFDSIEPHSAAHDASAPAPSVEPDPDKAQTIGGTDQGGMEPQQKSALEYSKRANEHIQKQGRDTEDRPEVPQEQHQAKAPEQAREEKPYSFKRDTPREAEKEKPSQEQDAPEKAPEFKFKRDAPGHDIGGR